MADISTWSTTAANNNSASPDGAPEGMYPSGVNDTIRENMAANRRFYENIEFRDWGHTVTQASATTFIVATDVTSIYKTGRIIQCTDATTIYGYIASASYSSPNTTITIEAATGSLTGSLTAVALGPDPTNGTSRLISPHLNEAVAITATATEVNILDGATLTTTELNYVDGVTSAIQTQMDTKAPSASPSFTGDVIVGTVTRPGSGAIAAENGLYHGTNRNTREVILDTPELITSSPTTGAWTTVDNTTLNTAQAITAIINIQVLATAGTTLGDTSQGIVYLRKTGSGLSAATITEKANAYGVCHEATYGNPDYDTNEVRVNLDTNYDFDYYCTSSISGGGTVAFDIVLVGYIVNS